MSLSRHDGKSCPSRSFSVLWGLETGELFVRGNFHAVGTGCVACDSSVESFGDLFPIAAAAQFLFVGRTANERDFRQNSRHRAFGKHDEAGFLDTAVAQAGILRRERAIERTLHTGRKVPRLLD